MSHPALPWIVFNLVIVAMLYLDLGVLQRRAHVISIKEAAIWSAVWVGVSLLFSVWVAAALGQEKALEFLTGYVTEKSLSVDNLFVFIMIFAYFQVPPLYQPRVLKWGILGALVMRLILILAGVGLIHLFHWLVYVLGAFLIFTGLRMGFARERAIEPDKNPVLKLFKRFVPVSVEPTRDSAFFIRKDGVRYATPLFVSLLIVEVSDLVFATDSIPAVLAISTDPFIVYTSNAFAVLGLRALYFLLSGIMGLFRYLKVGISAVLVFVGAKMCLVDIVEIPVGMSLGVVAGLLGLAVLISLVYTPAKTPKPPHA